MDDIMSQISRASTLKYISAPCGAGKTSELCKNINGSTEKYIIVQNTQKLAKKTAVKINDHKLIISDLSNGRVNVLTSVVNFLKKPTARTLIISDKTFFKIPVDLLSGWEIWLDDVTNFHSYKSINDGNSKIKEIIYHDFIQDHEIVDNDTKKYLTAKKKSVKGDLLFKILQELSAISESDIFIMNNDYFTEESKIQLNILGWKNVEKYLGLPVTFMGANFESSLIYKANPRIFEKQELPGLQQRKVKLEERVKVYYFSENVKLSKTWKNNNPEKLKLVYDYLDKKLANEIFYWANNNNDKYSFSSGTKISPDTRGLNDYLSYKTCVWLACMQPDDTEAKLCELLLGIDRDDIHQAREYENLHQFVLRGILRQFESEVVQTVYVFDKFQAKSISENIELIPGVIENIEPGVPGRPLGVQNTNKLPKLDGSKVKRFNRWKAANPLLDFNSFKAFLNSRTNKDLTEDEIEAITIRYERAVKNNARK